MRLLAVALTLSLLAAGPRVVQITNVSSQALTIWVGQLHKTVAPGATEKFEGTGEVRIQAAGGAKLLCGKVLDRHLQVDLTGGRCSLTIAAIGDEKDDDGEGSAPEESGRKQRTHEPKAEPQAQAPAAPPPGDAAMALQDVVTTTSGAGRGGAREAGGSVGLGSRGVGPGGGGKALGMGGLGAGHGSAVGYGAIGVSKRAANVAMLVPASEPPSSEHYTDYGKNGWVLPAQDHLSTFAVDVDTASYTIARRKLTEGQLPPPSSVRVEEFLNYFQYDYTPPRGEPFAVHMEAAPNPWNSEQLMLRIGVKGQEITLRERKAVHLTFLVDTSGSMQSEDKIGLVKRSLDILVNNLRDGDTVALCTYAGSVRDLLPPTGLQERGKILAAIEALTAGGSTAMASGITLAYQKALAAFERGAVNRVIVLSDGDANVGPVSHEEILKLIGGYVKQGVTLSTIGFGMGNYKDTTMEQLSNQGNGNYYYVDSLKQARRVFQEQLAGTLQVIAKDVKIQVDFNPETVRRYRLVGYENRDVADRDFRNDAVDAGEIGAGHSVTALYALDLVNGARPEEAAIVRIRAKAPDGETAREYQYTMSNSQVRDRFTAASDDFRFAAAAMSFAEVLRQNDEARGWSLSDIAAIARSAGAGKPDREELLALVTKADGLM